MILEMDVGNTRTKWRIYGAGDVNHKQTVYAELNHSHDLLQQIADRYEDIKRLRVCNVAGMEMEEKINHWALRNWQIKAEFARSLAQLGNVINSYKKPEKLGVDRWLAILAAYHYYPGESCVVDCGSAITIDLINKKGQHMGGYIVPGLSMSRQMLCNSTGQIRLNDKPSYNSLLPGKNTLEAVDHGSIAMQVGFIQRVVMLQGGKLILTGGDAKIIKQHLSAAIVDRNLVLNGLELALP